MGDSLPDKIVRFDVLQVEYGKAKLCRCIQPSYLIDSQNKLVYCKDCGAIVDPLDALISIARQHERADKYLQQQLEERRQIDNYKPRRVVIKNIEDHYNHHTEPTCPHCGKPFLLKSLADGCWTNAKIAEAFCAQLSAAKKDEGDEEEK